MGNRKEEFWPDWTVKQCVSSFVGVVGSSIFNFWVSIVQRTPISTEQVKRPHWPWKLSKPLEKFRQRDFHDDRKDLWSTMRGLWMISCSGAWGLTRQGIHGRDCPKFKPTILIRKLPCISPQIMRPVALWLQDRSPTSNYLWYPQVCWLPLIPEILANKITNFRCSFVSSRFSSKKC